MMHQQLNTPPLKTFYIPLLLSLLLASANVTADTALMHPVQDIHFQELPPPWAAQPIPNINTLKKNVSTKSVLTKNTPIKVKINSVVKASSIKPKATKKISLKPQPRLTNIQTLTHTANKGDPQAQYDLGLRYQYGNGVTKSRSKAHRWLNKSATAGNARAQYALSMFYQKYARNQQGVKKALLWLKKAADQGLTDAQYSLGMMFKNGSLVHNNQAESKKWLKMAASQGHVSAQLALQ